MSQILESFKLDLSLNLMDKLIEYYNEFKRASAIGNTNYFSQYEENNSEMGHELDVDVQEFLRSWLSSNMSTHDTSTQDFLYELVRCCGEFISTPVFRGCHRLNDGHVESYTDSTEVSAKFAGVGGYVISRDPEFSSVKGFRLSDFCFWVYNNFKIYDYLANAIDEYIGESEILVETNLSISTVFKVHILSGLY